MQIPLRTAENVRRMADRFNQIAPNWPHYRRLKALSAMFGYSSWEELINSCRHDAPDFVFDQDLDRTAREQRWIEMAKGVAIAAELELPLALDVVRFVTPTNDFRRPNSAWYQPNKIFDAEHSKDYGLWWCCIGEYGHPFIPPGFSLYRAVNFAKTCHRRVSDPHSLSENRDDIEEIWVLKPDDFEEKNGITGARTYFRRGELLEIDPVPMGDWLRSPKSSSSLLSEFFERAYPDQTADKKKSLMRQWRDALRMLNEAAGLPAQSKRRWIQFTLSTRKSMSKEWFWPLTPRSSHEEIGAAASHAERFDREICEYFGGNPGHVQITNE